MSRLGFASGIASAMMFFAGRVYSDMGPAEGWFVFLVAVAIDATCLHFMLKNKP